MCKVKRRKYDRRRERKEAFGMMLQLDASPIIQFLRAMTNVQKPDPNRFKERLIAGRVATKLSQ